MDDAVAQLSELAQTDTHIIIKYNIYILFISPHKKYVSKQSKSFDYNFSHRTESLLYIIYVPGYHTAVRYNITNT